MPHVIVAGATGAGKSVGLNVMLLSLLFRRTPEELRLLMVDPKVVELAPFDRIPHMLLPVVTDMKQAANALKWAVDEMERRYQLFADAGTKNITTYNAWADRVIRGEAKNPFALVVVAKDHNGLPEEIPAGKDESADAVPKLPEKLPFIVLVVDEFADLMMQQGKEVEAAVARLAQKARAAGMHVILATQRPSVDVITGMIKANFPTRIAYRVAQKVDSRTILDEQGAEHLLGRGDMLIKLNGTGDTKRVQCPMVSEEEVASVTEYLRKQGEPVYDENILKPRDEDGEDSAEDDAEQDPLYDDAVRLVADTHRCSTSWLQRKLGLGYNRAARIVEMMERRGLVGPANGSKAARCSSTRFRARVLCLKTAADGRSALLNPAQPWHDFEEATFRQKETCATRPLRYPGSLSAVAVLGVELEYGALAHDEREEPGARRASDGASGG
jgi:S-DNA-T family DNA segregation ATPase FtsK/SpoIIIE